MNKLNRQDGCPDLRKLLSIDDAADLLAVSTKSVRRWIATRELPAVQLGTHWRIRPQDLEAFIRDRLSR
jgi:excisionase family DNA binding protein